MTVGLVVVLAILVLNQVVMRVRALSDRDPIFYANLLLQAVAAVAVVVVGLPGTPAMPSMRFVLATLFALHVVQNLALRRNRQRLEGERQRLEGGRLGDEPPA